MKKRKNKALPLIILFVILAALVAGYLLLSYINSMENKEEDDTSVTAFEKENAIVTALEWEYNGTELAFDYVNDVWLLRSDTNYPCDSDKVLEKSQLLMNIKAAGIVDTDGADTDSFGLDDSALAVKANFSDGSEYTFSFGIVNSYNSCRYMKISGDDSIYMVEQTVPTAFMCELSTLYKSESWQLSGVTADQVTGIVIETADGKANEISYPETVEKLYNMIYKLNLGEWKDYYADASEMAADYGIAASGDRVTVNYNVQQTITGDDGSTTTAYTPASYTVYFGFEYESDDGNGYYYSPDGSSVVYLADKETTDGIFEYLTFKAPAESEETTGEN